MTRPETPGAPEEPRRTCIGCRARRGQSEMTRLALAEGEGGLSVRWDPGRKLGGRGAWLCRGSRSCLAQAFKKKAFGRAFRVSEPLDVREAEAGLDSM